MVDEFEFLKSLIGDLRVERLLPQSTIANGTARFKLNGQDSNRLHYNESVVVTPQNDSKEQNFSKSYTFLYLENQNKILKNFYEDKWSELEFSNIGNVQILSEYQCGDDLYEALYMNFWTILFLSLST